MEVQVMRYTVGNQDMLFRVSVAHRTSLNIKHTVSALSPSQGIILLVLCSEHMLSPFLHPVICPQGHSAHV